MLRNSVQGSRLSANSLLSWGYATQPSSILPVTLFACSLTCMSRLGITLHCSMAVLKRTRRGQHRTHKVLWASYYIPSRHTVPLWEMESDYYLHNFHVKTGQGSYKSMMMYQRTFGVNWGDDDEEESGLSTGESKIDNRNKESWRIERVRRRCQTQNEALSAWWKIAIQSYVQQRMWMSLGRSPSESIMLPQRFERLYQPEKLAQFDKFFARSWANPVRLTHEAQHSYSADDDTEQLMLHRKKASPTKHANESESKAEDNVELPGESTEEKSGDEESIGDFVTLHGFTSKSQPSLTHFLGSHGSYHETQRKAKEKYCSPSKSAKIRTPSMKFLGDLSDKPEPCDEYVKYANHSKRLNPCSKIPRESARKEFSKCLHETSLPSDDVEGIQRLVESAHISSEIRTGPYRGLSQNESATEVSTAVQERLNNLESLRRRGELRGGDLMGLNDTLRRRQMDTPGVKEAIVNGWDQSAKAERAYAEILDSSSLGCRRSDLTDERSMQLYCSFFDSSTSLSRLQKTYILGESMQEEEMQKKTTGRNAVSFKDEGNEVSSDEDKPEMSSFAASAEKLGIPMTSWQERTRRQSTSLFSYESRKGIPTGFEQINEDLYARKENRFMVMNGSSLDNWQSKPKPKTKVHRLEEDIVLLGHPRA
mmetsp:Transcript_41443/g.125485  ORF Transcript_41443/g.125485 Transcript_41443/m.125485 type:complete len:651 (-) Transcript_41443:39-1991(-)